MSAPRILFVHNGSPGRFAFLAASCIERGSELALINPPTGTPLPGAKTLSWSTDRGPTEGVFRLARKAEADMLRGHAAANKARELKASGFRPDVIIGHPGWGEMLFLGEVFPSVPQIQIGELYYRSSGADIGFDPEFPGSSSRDPDGIHAQNATLALSYAEATRLVVPTRYQASLFPAVFRSFISLIHEGVDTNLLRKIDLPRLLSKNTILSSSAPIITFINRFLEPLRGFHTMMRSLPSLLREVPDAQVVIVGSDSPQGYGIKPPLGSTWKGILLKEIRGFVDESRIHFLGHVSHSDLINLYSASTAHIYMTYPFVLSWSLLEAMSCECLIIGSDTAPVREIISNGKNGILVDFFDHERLAATLIDVCTQPARYLPLRKAARETIVSNYDRSTISEPAWLRLIDDVLRDTPSSDASS